jgi:hypothetical protein
MEAPVSTMPVLYVNQCALWSAGNEIDDSEILYRIS